MDSMQTEVFYELEKTPKSNNFLKALLLKMTLEPLVLFFILPSTMNHLITQNLFLEKSCRVNLAFNSSTCDALMVGKTSLYTKLQEIQVHRLASEMIMVKTFIHGIIPIFLMLFIGSWSDKHNKRKPCILVPIIGELVAVVSLVLNSFVFYQTPVILTSLAYSLPMAMSGGWPCLLLGVYTYVTTGTNEEELTLKIGRITTIQNIAMIIGIGLSGIVFNVLGFIGAYSTSFFMMLSSLVYGYYIIKERKYISTDLKIEEHNISKTKKELVKDFFKLEHFFKTMTFCFKTKKNKKILRMIALNILLIIINGPQQGELTVMYLFTRFKFGWNELNYAVFYGEQFIVQILGSLIALMLLSNYLKWRDESLGIIALAGSVLACLIFAFADEWIFYAGALVDLFNGTATIALRSLMAKLVPAHELGKANSIFGITESLNYLIFGILYSVVYKYTLHVFPGTIFLISCVLKGVGIPVFICLYHETLREKKDRGRNRKVDETDRSSIEL